MPSDKDHYEVLITSTLEPEHVKRLRQVDERLHVVYEPELIAPPRYPADHTGAPFQRTPEQETRWRNLLAAADILFDFDYTHRQDLPELAPGVRWIQSTSAGIGQFVKRYSYDQRMPNTTFTTASGIHARPLAEFCIMAMLMFNKGVARMWRDQARRHWERYAGTDLAGRTLGIIGVGKIGREIARLAHAFGMTALGMNATSTPVGVDVAYPAGELHALLRRSEYLVLCAPHTPQTDKLLGAVEFEALPPGAFFINIGRGACVVEPALIEALRSGHLGGAALDVFADEPLPQESPLWAMPNVLVSPHSASTSDRENSRLTDLFCDNLRRFLAHETLLNVLDPQKLY